MCGILAVFNKPKDFDTAFCEKEFLKGKGRGPESSTIEEVPGYARNTLVGFHRLAINGLDQVSNQPMMIDDITLICNGEIYNYKELFKLINITPQTNSDCEIIIHLYKLYGIDQTLLMLDGVFAFVLIDNRNYSKNGDQYCFIARDPYGVRPLFLLKHMYGNQHEEAQLSARINKRDGSDDHVSFLMAPNFFAVASELKMLSEMKKRMMSSCVSQFVPGTYTKCIRQHYEANWNIMKENTRYHTPSHHTIFLGDHDPYEHRMDVFNTIQSYLFNAVKKRVMCTDRPVACLLSGGLDSSLITALVNFIRKNVLNITTPLETYSIGLEGAPDLKYARKVADYLGTTHHEVLISEDEYVNAIPDVVKTIESYDTTTVRASIGNYLVGKYISENSEAKVIFNGDGSDELTGGYLYMHACKDPIEFDTESRRLLKNICYFDVLRSDRCISTHGLEPRTPFLDKTFVNKYLEIHPNIRCHGNKEGKPEKYLLRTAFSPEYFAPYLKKQYDYEGDPLLPHEILWRTKEAFSDGVSNEGRSGFEIIKERVESSSSIAKKLLNTYKDLSVTNKPETLEQMYYRYIFDSTYPDSSNVIPYFWMPRYVDSKDSSARTLDIYTKMS
tara:strand:- start:6810 stop:8651 length:1842 start_codon:yes stop_codon:yes gene_type:complete